MEMRYWSMKHILFRSPILVALELLGYDLPSLLFFLFFFYTGSFSTLWGATLFLLAILFSVIPFFVFMSAFVDSSTV